VDFGGGIYASESNVTLTNSTVSGNSAGDGSGGIYASKSNVTLTNSTVSGNSAGDNAGGIYIYGADSIVTLTNSTVSGNTAGEEGGGIFGGFSNVTLTNSTLSGNVATVTGGGGGIYADESSLTLTNSIIANSTEGDCVASSSTITATYNLIKDTGANACGLTNGTDDNIIGSDPELGALADNGCETKAGIDGSAESACVLTHKPASTSPALGVADTTVCAAPPLSTARIKSVQTVRQRPAPWVRWKSQLVAAAVAPQAHQPM